MATISLVMIVKNEEAVIARCLNSVSDLVDEIVIVDTGSDDNTRAISKTYTDKILHFPWNEHFARARNFSFSQATMDYILWLDADDVIEEESRAKLRHLKGALASSTDAVSMPYHLAFDATGRVTMSLTRNRLVKRSNNFQWHGAVHEYLAVTGHVMMSDIAICHYPLDHDGDRNILIYEHRLSIQEPFTARDWLYYAHELVDHGRYNEAIARYRQFFDIGQGWVEDNIIACGKLSDCYFHLGNRVESRRWALESFQYDLPRAEFCCRLGYSFLQEGDWKRAQYWYQLATNTPKPAETWSIVNYAAYTWLPHIQLALCLSHLEQYEDAYQHNEKAAQYLGEDPMVIHNRHFLQTQLSVLPGDGRQ